MRSFALLISGLLTVQFLSAREVDLRLWISGGMQGLLLGSRECPGWLSVARQLELEDPEGCWLQVGLPPVAGEPLRVPGLKFPDLLVPAESDFRLLGLSGIEQSGEQLSLLNVGALPQFPEYVPGFDPVGIWRQADGAEIWVFRLLSEKSPLKIPPEKLRPLRIDPPVESLRRFLTEKPLPDHALGVLVLPEDAKGPEWSDLFPEFPVLVQNPGSQAKIIELNQGTQLRIQPARFGRELVRVQLYWDTVLRRFRNPKAETVWVNAPSLQGVELASELQQRLHPLREIPALDLEEALLQHADAAWLPEIKSMDWNSRLPDALRAGAVPEDHAWVRVEIPRRFLTRWQEELPDTQLVLAEKLPDPCRVLLPAETVAGAGDWHSVIRQDLLAENFAREWMPFTTRDLLVPLGELP
ncbi:MAG: hypothetical protein ACO3NW_07570 [Kiritimatiellia bacterium]